MILYFIIQNNNDYVKKSYNFEKNITPKSIEDLIKKYRCVIEEKVDKTVIKEYKDLKNIVFKIEGLNICWVNGAKYLKQKYFEKLQCPICGKECYFIKKHMLIKHPGKDVGKLPTSNWCKFTLDRTHRNNRKKPLFNSGDIVIPQISKDLDEIISMEENKVILKSGKIIDKEYFMVLFYKINK